jgi:hypothetical protein
MTKGNVLQVWLMVTGGSVRNQLYLFEIAGLIQE